MVDNYIKVFYYEEKEYPIELLKIGDTVKALTLPYSAKYIDYCKENVGIVVSKDHKSIYDVKIKKEDGSVCYAIEEYMRASCIIEKIVG